MAETLPLRSGLNLRPGEDYPADPYYEQVQREQEYQQQLRQQQVGSRLRQWSRRQQPQIQQIAESLKAARSLRDLVRVVSAATIVALLLLFLEMHLRLIVCNLFNGSIPIIAEDKLNKLELGIVLLIDWVIITLISIFLIILIPLVAPGAFVGLIIKQWWEGIKNALS